MAATVYCKRCDRDYPVSEVCPVCGAKLGKNAVRVAWWHVSHRPATDWMCWNAIMRIALPVMAAIVVLIIALEALSGGAAAVEELLRSGLAMNMLLALGWLLALVLGLLAAQGSDIMECAVDAKGVHQRIMLVDPTPIKLILRLRSPRMMDEAVISPDRPPMVCVGGQDLAWRDIARVQLWPEKTMLLFYAPKWWLRTYLPCTPAAYEDSIRLIREKLGSDKRVILPGLLTDGKAAPAKSAARKPAPKKSAAKKTTARKPAAKAAAPKPVPRRRAKTVPDQVNMDELLADIRAMNAEEEERMRREDAH